MEQLRGASSTDELYELLVDDALTYYEKRETELSPEVMRQVERQVMLRIIDTRWREHLYEMDYLQEGINLRAMGQRDPLTEWQTEGFSMFGQMMHGIAQDLVRYVMHVQVKVHPREGEDEGAAASEQVVSDVSYSAPEEPGTDSGVARAAAATRTAERRSPTARRRSRMSRSRTSPSSSPGGRRPRATRPARAGRARSSSSATARPRALRCATSPTTSRSLRKRLDDAEGYLDIDRAARPPTRARDRGLPARPVGRP